MNTWTQERALAGCRELEPIIASMGMHIGLTGGCLYKHGPRKDMDIILYRHHGAELPTFEHFCNALEHQHIPVRAVHHNVIKCEWMRSTDVHGWTGGVDFILRGGVSWPETEACPEGSSDTPTKGKDADDAKDEDEDNRRLDALVGADMS